MISCQFLVQVALVLVLLQQARATCTDNDMTLVSLGAAGPKCANGEDSGYFIASNTGPPIATGAKFVIWLGDSELCADEASCLDFCKGEVNSVCDTKEGSYINHSNVDCYVNELHCGSKLWNQTDSRPDTVLCGDSNSVFESYVRVYVPQCSLDWFLGTGTVDGSITFGGALILDAVIQDLVTNYNLNNASQIVLGGTRGGAIGALNQYGKIATTLTAVPDIRVILDSAWFINTREFGVTNYANSSVTFQFDDELKDKSKKWIGSGVLDSSCNETYVASGNLHRCLYPENLVTGTTLRDKKLLIVQSQFDLVMLLDLGLTDGATASDFVDEAAYSQAVFSYVRGFGTAQRQSYQTSAIDSTVVATNTLSHYWWSPSCGQHGWIVPLRVHAVEQETKTVGEAGSISFKRTGTEWEEVNVLGLSLRETIKQWAVDDITPNSGNTAEQAIVKHNIRADRCGEFLCNPTCTSRIEPFVLETKTSPCEQNTIMMYCTAFLAVMWLGFIVTLLRVCCFDVQCRMYWASKKAEEGRDGKMDQKSVEKQILTEAAKGTKGRSVQLMVENLSYWAPPKKRGLKPYQILKNVNVNLQAGTVHAMMGPSGSGKSTLLDVISYTRETGRVTGTHYINGVASHLNRAGFLREWLRSCVSYVRQQDVFFPHLTVREHLQHAAWLMLPQYMDNKKKFHRIWQVLKLLELDQCADTKCGDGGVRVQGGISGGQRRRVSVATQLLKMPAALLLDEPTSGLDATNALLLVRCLNNLAHKSGVSVIMTIHQPRREIFVLLDYLTILVRGRVIFSGPPKQAADFFQVDPNDVNIGDSILDMLQTNESCVEEFRSKYINGPLGRAVIESMEAEKTELTPKMATGLRAILMENALAEGKWSWTENASTITTMWVLMSRTIKRDKFDIVKTSLMSLVGGLLVGLVFLGSATYTGHTALAYLAVSTMTFLQGTFLGDRYMLEKQMWSHEKDTGTTVNWLAFLICLFLRNVVTSTIEGMFYAVPVFFMGNLFADSFEQVFNFFLLLTLVAVSVTTQNTTVEIDRIRRGGEASPDTRQAILINMALLSLSALFNGFIIQLKDIPAPLAWIPYLMLSYWGFVGVLVNNFTGESFPCEASALECATRTGDQWIRSFQYDDRDVYQCMFALLVLIIALHFISVLDFYLRFARARSELKRGKPKGVEVDDDDGMSFTGSPTMAKQGSLNAMAALMDNEEGDGNKKKGAAVRGKLFSALLSRENLVFFLILDVLTAWYLCFFSTGASSADSGNLSPDAIKNQTADILSGNFELGDTDPVFILLNVIVYGVYIVQFIIQVLFLVPLSSSGFRSSLLWLSPWDLGSLVFLAADGVLILGLFLLATDLQMQLMFVVLIRFARYCSVACYWCKVDHFHRSRAKTYLKLAKGGHVSVDMDDNYNSGSIQPMEGFDDGGLGGMPPPAPSRGLNRISGMFKLGSAPPIAPSRTSQSYRAMNLGSAWQAYQQEPQFDDDEV